jgi:hypothetical protein
MFSPGVLTLDERVSLLLMWQMTFHPSLFIGTYRRDNYRGRFWDLAYQLTNLETDEPNI